jgi:hypothetical protein
VYEKQVDTGKPTVYCIVVVKMFSEWLVATDHPSKYLGILLRRPNI